jgi:hypothetical protein
MLREKKEKGETPKLPEDGTVFVKGQLMPIAVYLETIKNEVSTIPSAKKEELIKQILVGLSQVGDRFNAADYDHIAKAVKKEMEVSAGPSLVYAINKRYIRRIKADKKRAFYVMTETGASFAGLTQKVEELKEVHSVDDNRVGLTL